jgi:hypothetical protein
MRRINCILTVAIAATLLGSLTTTVESSTSTLSFVSAPTSADVTVTSRSTAGENAYYFTLILPEQPQEGFSQLSFTELNRDRGADPIRFDFARTEAFIGTPDAIDRAVNTNAWIDETGTFWVEVDPTVSPGTTLTVVFKAEKPPSGASYEYGVAAYPEHTNPVAVFVGNGTLDVERSQLITE